jgi:hypothetical protein
MPQSERNTRGLAEAAEGRRERAFERARNAIRRLDQAGEPVSFQAVAREAGVSRQFLYTVDQLRREIERLRTASLKARNQMLLDENRRLRDELGGLREELAGAWGELRGLQRERRRTGPGTAASS